MPVGLTSIHLPSRTVNAVLLFTIYRMARHTEGSN